MANDNIDLHNYELLRVATSRLPYESPLIYTFDVFSRIIISNFTIIQIGAAWRIYDSYTSILFLRTDYYF